MKRILIYTSVGIFFSVIPLIAMEFTNEVQWDGIDFMAFSLLLLVLFIGIELIRNKVKTKKMVWISVMLLIVLLLIVWIDLAVGLLNYTFSGSYRVTKPSIHQMLL